MPALYFAEAEYKARLEATKVEMQRLGADTLILSDPANIFYLTGFDAWAFYSPLFLVVSCYEDEPMWIGRFMDAVSARDTTYLREENIQAYPDSFVQSNTSHPVQPTCEILQARGLDRGAIGVEMGAYYYTARIHAEFIKHLPNARFHDAELLVNRVRLVKSVAEQAYMRQAGRIVDGAMTAAVERCAPGVRECDVVAEIYQAQISGSPEAGGVYTTSPPHFCAAERVRTPHGLWTDKPLVNNRPLNIEIAGSRLHYHCPITRTVFLGRPPDGYLRLAEAVVEGLNKTMDSIRPGIAAEEVELVWRRSIAKHGFEKEARLGYSIGLGFPPTWGERTASLRPGDKTVLRSGMAFHCMSGLWLEDTGIAITQSFLVTDSGNEPLTQFERQLITKP
ncbi:M24 family metallopeptidase [Rhizobium lentis]|uniref:Xaa-Pro aminopeptidase n=1 Tax=Rhizobium lentis TaxID=1138194 RepID=A0A7W9CYB8_9HYPH|nr:Xaa-Pro peptidase family protein [Rhizobium lentis]MBB4577249.1 Xaa-Pro aminopeptidase [Rhizobium lentis]MBB5553812.1 Xaa-Pro aminopeptidase [Rhizobium lentis]MBB5564373.1 Xaa-Pro aminopeptidase [Rhizobium lentis]MBB5570827.1 Xaa-Pro aminopeptidase [Rhizobium lentis]